MTEQQFHILAVAMLGFARNPQQTYENARAVLQQIAESGAFDTSGAKAAVPADMPEWTCEFCKLRNTGPKCSRCDGTLGVSTPDGEQQP